MNLKRFAACLKKAISTKEAYAALDKGPGGTWTAGGCWTLAHAVNGLVDGELMAIVTPAELELDEDGNEIDPGYEFRVQHVVVKVGRQYLDGDGLSTEKKLLRRWNEDEGLGDGDLVPFTEDLQAEALADRTLCDTQVVTAILPSLMKCVRRR